MCRGEGQDDGLRHKDWGSDGGRGDGRGCAHLGMGCGRAFSDVVEEVLENRESGPVRKIGIANSGVKGKQYGFMERRCFRLAALEYEIRNAKGSLV